MRLFALAFALAVSAPAAERITAEVPIAPVWAGHPVGFSLLTHGSRQFAAYYDADRRMTVAARNLDETNWVFQVLPEAVKWDSHNSVTMAVDDADHLHVSGNMHVVPLVYFRTTRPLDPASLERVPAMVGAREQRVTYPRFLRGASNELLFTYRDGSSGNGDQLVNVYDVAARTWRRLLDTPLFNGAGRMNAYFVGPVRGPDGFFHLVWVWRDHGGCESNHDLSYARSRDLVHWETSAGRPLALPITLPTAEIVDPVPVRSGLLNGHSLIGFDGQGRVILSYHKVDTNGFLQICNARREEGAWRIRPATDWTFRWDFSGGGTIRYEAGLSAVATNEQGRLVQSWWNAKDGHSMWELDPATLRPLARTSAPGVSFAESDRRQGPLPAGLRYQGAEDLGGSDEPGVRYVLRWATRPANRDQPYPGEPPPPQLLRVVRLSGSGG
jgi:hypothetical protein